MNQKEQQQLATLVSKRLAEHFGDCSAIYQILSLLPFEKQVLMLNYILNAAEQETDRPNAHCTGELPFKVDQVA